MARTASAVALECHPALLAQRRSVVCGRFDGRSVDSDESGGLIVVIGDLHCDGRDGSISTLSPHRLVWWTPPHKQSVYDVASKCNTMSG